MADEKVNAILFKIQRSSVLSDEELKTLQLTVDQLENRGLSASTHHSTDSTPGSHHAHHHSTSLEVAGFLDIAQKGRQ
jgi:hypothetical protein